MRVFKTTYRDRKGVTQESSKWYVEFRDHAETIRRLPAFTSKQASEAFSYINGLRQAKNGISAQTFNFYLQAIKQFCRWMVKDRRATENPLLHLQGLNVHTDRRHDRRALSLEELTLLLQTATDGPVRFNLAGPERALLYSHSDHDKELAAMRALPNLPKPAPKASKAPEKTDDSASNVLAFCLAQNGTSGEISRDSGRLNEEDKTASQAADETQLVAVLNGGGEIRTHGTLAGPPVFKTGAFNRSATPPDLGRKCSWGGKIRQKGWGNG